jgi:hypothetical protein
MFTCIIRRTDDVSREREYFGSCGPIDDRGLCRRIAEERNDRARCIDRGFTIADR